MKIGKSVSKHLVCKLIAVKLLSFLMVANLLGFENQLIRPIIDLSGKWQFQMDDKNVGNAEKWYSRTFTDFIILPGTMDENKKGSQRKDTTDYQLNRPYSYYGAAWYQKEIDIPAGWNDKRITLIMERTKVTKVWIDTFLVGTNKTLFTKQVYDLTSKLSSGKHTLTICVDNNPKLVPVDGSHAYSDDTQTNWNGIIGQFCLEASNVLNISSVKVFPDLASKSVKVKVLIHNPGIAKNDLAVVLHAESWNTQIRKVVPEKKYKVSMTTSDSAYVLTYPMGADAVLWSEFDPALYKLTVSLENKGKTLDEQLVDFGMRDFKTQGTQFTINGVKTFLRGKHEACVFPLTGYPPMDTAGWMRVFRIAKSYGLNHYRFHSWCPPEAAFKAADICGIYLQPELPAWWFFNARNPDHISFLMNEGRKMLDNYGSYASYVMMSLGNELYQDRTILKQMVSDLRAYDPRHLYAQGTNNYGGNPSYAEGDDYWASQRIAQERPDCSSDIRLSNAHVDAKEGGILNTLYPNTTFTYAKALSGISVPVIGHEVGQYQTYPNYDEVKKYTGVLKPWNFEYFRKQLAKKGMLDQAYDFFKASGALSVICYRQEIETAIRTNGFGGFQLLDLQDYPGQGTALVGLLDAFMDSKGLITPELFRQFCDKVVLLASFDKYCWMNNETFKANIQIANYSPVLISGRTVSWAIYPENSQQPIKIGSFSAHEAIQGSVSLVGSIEVPLIQIAKAQKLLLTLKVEGLGYQTEYPLWVYPENRESKISENIITATKLDEETFAKLDAGKSVLIFPDFKVMEKNSVPGQFISEFWNYKMFKGFADNNKKGWSPGTMGILTNPGHPIFNDFPTDFYTNWQWWSILKNSRPLILDNTPKDYRSVVQMIDNIDRNYKLGLIMECKVGKGKLLICTSNLPAIQDKPEARQLLSSILKYMSSEKFNPVSEISKIDLSNLIMKN